MSLVFGAAAAFAAFVSPPAPSAMQDQVGPDEEVVIVRGLPPSRNRLMRTVYIGDLDLAAQDGQEEMEKRVAHAVDELCAIPNPIPTYGERMTRPCRDEAWESARPQMDRAMQRVAAN